MRGAPCFFPYGGALMPFEELRAGEKSQKTPKKVKLMSFIIIYVISGLQRHIFFLTVQVILLCDG